MNVPENILDIFLQPGDFFWGDSDTRIRTILGSCVAICLWHPVKREGGMCHYMLPSRGSRKDYSNLDGRYADEAWELFRREIIKTGTKPSDYVTKLFGGASMFDNLSTMQMGARNIEVARKIVAENNLKVASENMGGNKSRRVHFEIWSGNVWLKRQEFKEDKP
jgi:chemotaxis protein CheD